MIYYGFCTFLERILQHREEIKSDGISSIEVEIQKMAQYIYELFWLKIILEYLKIQLDNPMKLYCDNNSTISKTQNPMQHV